MRYLIDSVVNSCDIIGSQTNVYKYHNIISHQTNHNITVASHGPQCGLTWASLWPHMGLNVASNKSQIESKMILSNDFIVFWPQSVL